MDPERQNEEIEVADQPDNYSLEEGKVDEEEPPIEAGEFDQQPQVGAAADVGIRRSREFPRRQVQMMALGISIGTGLLFESGWTLNVGGPVSLLLAYICMGTVLYAVMRSLGEQITLLPIPGAVFTMSNRTLFKALGFACGYSYWFAYVIDFPNKIASAASFMAFWSDLNPAIFMTIFLIFPIAFNLLNVRKYGEIEYWFTTIKVLTIVGLVVTGLLIAMGAAGGPYLLGTDENYRPVDCINNAVGSCVPDWRLAGLKSFLAPGAAGRFFGFWECCCLAVFSYTGCEMLGITADETERQRENIPKAVKRVTHRIILYYVSAVFTLGLNVSANDPILTQTSTNVYHGAFIVMLQRAGIPGLPHLVNAVMVVAAVSVATADVYSRSLYGLSMEGHAPAFLQFKVMGVPYAAVGISALLGPLAYMTLGVGTANVFSFLFAMTTTAILIPWAAICASYIRFRQAIRTQRLETIISRESKSVLQPFLAWYGLIWCIILLIFQGYKVYTRGNSYWNEAGHSWGFELAPYTVIAGFFVAFAGAYLVWGERMFRIPGLPRIDLASGRARVLAIPDTVMPKWKLLADWILNAI